MSYQCERCGRIVDKIVLIEDAFRSAQYTELLGIPYFNTDHVCITCAREILEISDAYSQCNTQRNFFRCSGNPRDFRRRPNP